MLNGAHFLSCLSFCWGEGGKERVYVEWRNLFSVIKFSHLLDSGILFFLFWLKTVVIRQCKKFILNHG